MKVALIGYGNVGRAFGCLVEKKRQFFPLLVTGIHTARHGTAICPKGLPPHPEFGPPAASVEEFLDNVDAEVVAELTPLNPADGEPALSHIRAAFARGKHVVTANKGPIAHAYASLRDEAQARGLQFRFESTVMDGAPVYNMVRHNLPGVRVLGFTGVLNSTTKIIVEWMREGRTLEEGIDEARRLGIAEANPYYDIDGWDSAVKAAALANVLMDAQASPASIQPRGIGRLTPARVQALHASGKTVRIVSRAKRTSSGVKLRVRAEVLNQDDLLASVKGTSNLLLFHTDLMGTIGTVSIDPTVHQTAYGVYGDIVDIAREL